MDMLMANILSGNDKVKRAQADKKKKSAQAPDEYSPTSKKPRNPDPNDDPAGSTVVSNETFQKALMYLGIPVNIIKTRFPIGDSIANTYLIALRNHRSRMKTTGADVAPGMFIFNSPSPNSHAFSIVALPTIHMSYTEPILQVEFARSHIYHIYIVHILLQSPNLVHFMFSRFLSALYVTLYVFHSPILILRSILFHLAGHVIYALQSCEVPLPPGVTNFRDLTHVTAGEMFTELALATMEDPRSRADPIDPWDVYNMYMQHGVDAPSLLKLSRGQMFDLRHQMQDANKPVTALTAAESDILTQFDEVEDYVENPAPPAKPAAPKPTARSNRAPPTVPPVPRS